MPQVKSRIDHKDLRLAWKDRDDRELLALVKRASNKTIKRAADELQARNPGDGAAFRKWLSGRGVHLNGKGGPSGPTFGSVRSYSVQGISRQLFIRLPVELMEKQKGDEIWVYFETAESFRVYASNPQGRPELHSIRSPNKRPGNG